MMMIVLLICFGVSLIAVEGRTDYCPRRQNFFSGISSHFDTTTYQLLDLDQYVLHIHLFATIMHLFEISALHVRVLSENQRDSSIDASRFLIKEKCCFNS